MNRATRWLRPGACVLLAGAAACYGGRVDADAGKDDTGDGTQGAEGSGDDGLAPVDELPAPATRFFRLTHTQWDNTVRDLLRLAEPLELAVTFRADPKEAGFLFDNAAGLDVDNILWGEYQRAAADVARLATTDEAIRAAIYPPEDGTDKMARFDAFIRELGRRAYRRPLTDAELARFAGLAAGAEALYDDATGFDAAARLAIETILQSPAFLYRIESSTEVDGDVIRLDDYEVAQRLSYFLWGSMPDDALFEAAAHDALGSASEIEAQARRMLDDPRARDIVASFHGVLFEADRIGNAGPAPGVFPDVPPDLGVMAQQELARFVEATVFERNGGVVELLSSNETFVNAELAAIYGIPGEFGAELVPATLDPDLRRGVLTQIGFLIANASSVHPDPIHRGKFVLERITCQDVGAPPDEIPPLPEPEGRTNREAIEALTEAPGTACAACHATLINPFGFPFESYDAVGAFRTEDGGRPIDSASEILLDGQATPVADAIELVERLVASPAVHRCYVQHWIELAAGRPTSADDDPLLDRLADDSLVEDISVRDLLVAIVVSQPFRTRAIEELP